MNTPRKRITLVFLFSFAMISSLFANTPPGREMPSESELIIAKIEVLSTTTEAGLQLSTDQITVICSILKEWSSALSDDSESDSNPYITQITEELNEDQSDYMPTPPDRMGGPQGGENGGDRPEGGRPPRDSQPEKRDLAEMISGLILALEDL